MATPFKLPEVGENIESAKVVRVLVSVGDTISEDQTVLEIETDKATLEVPSEVGGKITKLNVKEGGKINVGDVVLEVEGGGEEAAPAAEEKKSEPVPKAEAPAKPSKPAESAQSEEPAKPAEAPKSEEKSAPKPVAAGNGPTLRAPEPGAAIDDPNRLVPAAPSVRRLAREIGVDIYAVKGSGAGGRISVEDVKAHARGVMESVSAGGAAGAGAGGTIIPQGEPLPDFSKYGPIEEEELSGIRKVIGKRLGYAWATIPHVHQHDKADITELEEFRKRYNARLDEGKPRLTVTAVIVKVLAGALMRHPKVNSTLDLANEKVIYKQYVNIGVAVDTPKGLLVPVLRNVNAKSVVRIVEEMDAFAVKARDGKIKPDDMKGGTFTVSNLGGIGGTSFNPIVNPPEAAILGVARAGLEGVWDKEGNVRPRLLLPLCLGYDHRVIDGAEGARFLREICEILSNPTEMFLMV